MTTHNAQIELTQTGAGRVVVNGVDLSRAARGITLEAEVGCRPVLHLELVLHDVSTVAETRILIPDETAAALVALGWTPPPGQEDA